MSDHDLLMETVDAIYASGVDGDYLPKALESTSRLFNAAGALLKVIDKPSLQLTEFYTVGASPIVDRNPRHSAPFNPRIPLAFRQGAGDIGWDYQLFDEAGMSRDPFYAEFLPNLGLRYFISAVLKQTPNKLTALTVQRTKKQGHVDGHEIALMRRLCPHFQRSHDMASRLKVAGNRHGALENTFDWLTDGVALLRADGQIVYANEALCTFAKRGDGFRIVDDIIEFVTPQARRSFIFAFNAMEQVCNNPSVDAHPTDFPISRSDGTPAYTVAVRPLTRGQMHETRHADAIIMLFIHDPLSRNITGYKMLQELFGLTNAEISLAQALCAGMTTDTYASTRRVSLNTVYTHLRRIREKTSCNSIAELVRRFSELNMPLRQKLPNTKTAGH